MSECPGCCPCCLVADEAQRRQPAPALGELAEAARMASDDLDAMADKLHQQLRQVEAIYRRLRSALSSPPASAVEPSTVETRSALRWEIERHLGGVEQWTPSHDLPRSSFELFRKCQRALIQPAASAVDVEALVRSLGAVFPRIYPQLITTVQAYDGAEGAIRTYFARLAASAGKGETAAGDAALVAKADKWLDECGKYPWGGASDLIRELRARLSGEPR